MNRLLRLKVIPRVLVSRTFCVAPVPEHVIKMPALMDFKTGKIDEWLVAEGDVIRVGQDLCHVSVGDLVVGVESQHSGVLALVHAPAGETEIAADQAIAVCVDSTDDYTRFLQAQLRAARQSIEESVPTTAVATEAPAATVTVTTEPAGAATTTDLLREVKNMIKSGAVVEESDFAKRLLSQCRKGNPELLSVFVASFEDGSTSFDHERFDANFFLDNAKDILEELEAIQPAVAYKDTVDTGGASHLHQANPPV